MTRSKRTLRVEAQDVLIRGRVVGVVKARDWKLLEEVARIVEADVPIAMAASDPAMYATLRAAITRHHLKGWSHMTAERVRQVADGARLKDAGDGDCGNHDNPPDPPTRSAAPILSRLA
jgi:hypothetical protein